MLSHIWPSMILGQVGCSCRVNVVVVVNINVVVAMQMSSTRGIDLESSISTSYVSLILKRERRREATKRDPLID